ncbi:MAG TPA: peptidoglycan-associated lipoprotein Pal [Methylomirabilota bacterium]|nr:peptidoglycan-associated lipoprotein Pal [Methylomirabilota bacterium]
MRILLLVLMLPLAAACSTMRPSTDPSAAVAEASETDISGRWKGNWTGTGLFHAIRDDALTLDLVQRGPVGHGRLVLEGTGAAEAVPQEIRLAGLWGTRVFADISRDKVTLRDYTDGRQFTVDLKLSENGNQMFGFVRGAHPHVGLVLNREHSRKSVPEAAAVPQQSAMATPVPAEPEPAKVEPAPQVVAMVPEPKAEEKEAEPTARPRQEEFVAVQELKAVHFDFDKADLRAEALDTLQVHVGWLKENADTAVLIEGHCDERGTAEYNVALGDRRAKSVREYLSAYGIAADRVTTVSYGKERPACAVDTAQCHEANRRAEFRVKSR